MEESKKKLVEEWFKSIEETGVNLSKWEEDFVESVKEQFTKRGSLSEKQLEILERIYAERAD